MSAMRIASFVMLTSLVACGASPDADADEPDEPSTDSVSSALLQLRDDAPVPFEAPVPSLDFSLGRPIWDPQPYLDEFRQRPRFGRPCVMRWVTIREPSGRVIEVPVTVCN